MRTKTASAEDGLDRQLARAAAGDQAALEALYARPRPAVYALALSIVKNAHDAEDVMQDVYVRVWQGAGNYRGQGTPMAWLLTVTRNLALDCRRWQAKLEPLDLEGAVFLAPAVTHEDRVLLSALLEGLEETERQIVVLHALGGLKHRETAALLELPLGTVLARYSRAVKKLRLAGKEAGLDV